MRISSFVFSMVLGLGLGALWLGVSGQSVQAARRGELHVCPSGCAYQTAQAAVDAAAPGDVVKIAEGVYTGVSSRNGLTQVLYVDKSLDILGGFTTADWSQPDPQAHPAVLDAQELGRVLVIRGNVTVTVEGLRLQRGDASGLLGGPVGAVDFGGGVYVLSATVTISNCRILSSTGSTLQHGYGGGAALVYARGALVNNLIRGNTAGRAGNHAGNGGGAALWHSRVTLRGNDIRDNTGSHSGLPTPTGGYGNGGGVYVFSSEPVTLTQNSIQGNTASIGYIGNGGGVYLEVERGALSGNRIVQNLASQGYYGFGGGLRATGIGANAAYIVITNNVFLSNTAAQDASLLWRSGMGGGVNMNASGSIVGNIFRNNTASTSTDGFGGGLYLEGGGANNMQVQANQIVSNTATRNLKARGRGGGISIHLRAQLANNIIAENYAHTNGSGICHMGAEAPVGYVNNTIAFNQGASAVYIAEPPVQAAPLGAQAVYTPAFTNTLLAGNEGFAVEVGLSTTVAFQATLWHGNGGLITGPGQAHIGGINVYADPGFVAESDYHIRAGSPAQDAGLPAGVTSDVDGEPRPYGRRYDIGADEVQASALYLPLLMR